MKLLSILIPCMLLSFALQAQDIEIFGGANLNQYTRIGYGDLRQEPGVGMHFGIGWNNTHNPDKRKPFDIYLSYEKYHGSAHISSYTNYSYQYDTQLSKQMVGLAIYGLPIRLLKQKLSLTFGVETAYQIAYTLSGTETSRFEDGSITTSPLSDNQLERLRFSAATRLAYTVPINQNLSFKAQYHFNINPLSETIGNPRLQSMIHRFGVAVIFHKNQT